MGPRAGLDMVSKKKILSLLRESNYDHPIAVPTELSSLKLIFMQTHNLFPLVQTPNLLNFTDVNSTRCRHVRDFYI
jgi:hypothetical protein